MRRALKKMSIAMASAGLALGNAAVVVSQTGNDGGFDPLGYYAPYGSNNPGVGAVEWSQTSTFFNVTISANVWEPNGQPIGTINYTLVTSIGSGSSYATSGVAEGSVTALYDPGYVALVTLPSLGPGTYYLVLDSPSTDTGWSYGYPSGNSTIATDPSASFLGEYSSRGAFVDGGYTPGSTFFDSTPYVPLEFSVESADPTGAPEPRAMLMVGLGLAGLGWLGRRRR